MSLSKRLENSPPLRRLLNHPFASSVFKLASATMIAQGLSLLMIPVLSRLYPPESFGVLSLYLSVVSIGVVFSTLNYDVAITAPKEESDSVSLVYLSALLVACFSGATVLIVAFLPESGFVALNLGEIYPWRFLLPLGLLGAGIYSCLQYFSLRKKAFGLVAKTSVLQSILQALFQGGFGAFGALYWGLLLGDLANRSGGVSSLYLRVARQSFAKAPFRFKNLKKVAFRYRQYPQYGLASDLLIAAGVSLPPILVGSQWGLGALGFFMMTYKIMDIPGILLGNSVSRVFLSEAMTLYANQRYSEVRRLFLKTSLRLFMTGAVLLPALAGVFYMVAGAFLGENWESTRGLGLLLLPLFVARLTVSPVSQIAAVIERQRIEAIMSLLRVVALFALFGWVRLSDTSFEDGILAFSVLMAMTYMGFFLTYFVLVLRLLQRDSK